MGAARIKPPLKKCRVYVAQINQTMVFVEARTKEEAGEKGYAKWRREWAHSEVISVEQHTATNTEGSQT